MVKKIQITQDKLVEMIERTIEKYRKSLIKEYGEDSGGQDMTYGIYNRKPNRLKYIMTKIIKLNESDINKLLVTAVTKLLKEDEDIANLYNNPSQDYTKYIQNIDNQFSILERTFNEFDLNQLVYNYELRNVIDKAVALQSNFNNVYNEFDKMFNNLNDDQADAMSDLEHEFYKINDKIERFVGDLDDLNEAIKKINEDLIGRSHYFTQK